MYLECVGKEINKKQAIVNYIRRFYESSEEAYLKENNLKEAPRCKFCSKKLEFISFFKGYASYGNNYCSYSCFRKATNRTRKKGIHLQDYIKFIKENKEFYKENWNKTGVVEPYFKEKLSISLGNFVKKKIDTKFLYKEYVCDICGKTFLYNPFEIEKRIFHGFFICPTEKCGKIMKKRIEICNEYKSKQRKINSRQKINNLYYNLWIKYKDYNKAKEELLKIISFRDFEKLNKSYITKSNKIKFLIYCPETLFFIPIISKNHIVFEMFLRNEMKMTKEEYLKKFFPHSGIKCIVCKEIYKYSVDKIYSFINYKQKIKYNYCSNKCYIHALKTKKGELYSEEYKNSGKKISKILKEKILKGEFSPCRINSFTRTKISFQYKRKEFKFRSSWEFFFWLLNKDNQNLFYEYIRIPYYIDNKQHIYIVDFYEKEKGWLIEIKSKVELNRKINLIKFDFARKFCKKHNLSFKIITEDYFLENLNLIEKSFYNIIPNLKNLNEDKLKLLKDGFNGFLKRR